MRIYLGGMSAGISDFSGTPVRVDVCVGDLPDPSARALLIGFLDDTGGFERRLAEIISRPDSDSWSADFNKLEDWLSRLIAEKDFGSSPAFDDAWERNGYLAKGADKGSNPDARERLASELADHAFSAGDGLKLLMTRFPNNEGEKIARIQADRLLWRMEEERNLTDDRKKKPLPRTSRAATPPYGAPSNSTSTLSKLVQFLLLKNSPKPSNKPPAVSGKKLMVCGVLVLAVVLAAKCRNKVTPKQPPPPVRTAPSAPDQGQAAEPPPTDEQPESATAPPVDGDPAPQ